MRDPAMNDFSRLRSIKGVLPAETDWRKLMEGLGPNEGNKSYPGSSRSKCSNSSNRCTEVLPIDGKKKFSDTVKQGKLRFVVRSSLWPLWRCSVAVRLR